MAIKILVISNYNDKHSTRPEAEVFISLKNKGFEITVMTYPGSFYYERFKENEIRVIPFHPEKKHDKKAVKIIKDELLKNQYDILHLFNRKAFINGIKAAKRIPVKVVLYRGYTGKVKWWDPKAYSFFLHPRVNKIVCLTDLIKKEFEKNPFFNKNKLVTIHKGHDVNWYNNVEQINLSESGIPEDAFVLVNIANERQMKGTKYLLKSSYFLPKDSNIHYIIIGKGRDAKKHLKIAENSPNSDKIHFFGFREDVLTILKASNTSIMSSTKREGIPKSVIESMCVETTPIITDIFGELELVKDQENGLVIPKKNPEAIADAVIYLYKNPEKNIEFGKNAKKYIDHNFNIARTVNETAEFYQSLL